MSYINNNEVQCRECDGLGTYSVTEDAHQEAGNIVDGDTYQRQCHVCGGEGYVPEDFYAQADWEAAQKSREDLADEKEYEPEL